MPDYTELDADDLGVDRFATSPTAQALYDNPIAIAEGASGAPRIQTGALQNLAVTSAKLATDSVTSAKIADDAVTQQKVNDAAIGQNQLETATGTVSTAGSSNLTLPGGQYGFYPQISSTGGTMTGTISLSGSFGGFTTNIGLSVGTASLAEARQRYVEASPPYDLGDGDVPLFIFALVDASGKIISSYAAETPPWAYNGPTDIRPDLYEKRKSGTTFTRGRPLKRVRRISPSLRLRLQSADPVERAAALLEQASAPLENVVITTAFKNTDMELIPHPFLQNALAGLSVILLDPVCQVVEQARALHREGESVPRLLHRGLITFDNVPLGRHTPNGVKAFAPKWRVTR